MIYFIFIDKFGDFFFKIKNLRARVFGVLKVVTYEDLHFIKIPC